VIFKVDEEAVEAIVGMLLYELIVFVIAAYQLFVLQLNKVAYAFITISIVQYLVSTMVFCC
jgi:hypothetical protein